MGWFDKQIRQIKQNDQIAFEESVFSMASVILGKHDSGVADDERTITKAAIDEVLKYYHCSPSDIPASIKDPEEQLTWSLRPHGMMHRDICLKKGWYKDSFGPVLGFFKESKRAVALLPMQLGGYYYHDPESGKRIMVNRATAALLDDDAICFYRPFPLKKLRISDFLVYINNCINFGDTLIFILLALAVTLIGMLMPQATKVLTGLVVDSGSKQFLMGTAIFMLCQAIAGMLIQSAKSLSLYKIKTKITLGVKAAMMSRIMSLPSDFFRKYSAGDLTYRADNAERLCEILMDNVVSMGFTFILSFLYVIQIVMFAPVLVIPALTIILLVVLISAIATLWQIKYSKLAMEAGAVNNGLSYALITGVQKIKLSGAEKRAFAKWAKSYVNEAKYTYDIPVFLKASNVFSKAVGLIGLIVIYYIAARGNVSPSNYMAFNVAYGSVMGAMVNVSQVILMIAKAKPMLEMAEPILEAEPESSEDKMPVESIGGSIELNNVYFRYDEHERYIVNGMNLKIKSGEYIAIVGKTGCGKSTLVRLLLGFEKPEKGAIYYDNRDMNKLDLHTLRKKIGTVTQDGSLFQDDIFSNISISAPQMTLDDAWEAAEIAGIADDIRRMPMGMNTLVSEGQGGISGGQKQRILIARAIAPKPKILIFDEATSALDNKTQKKISDALDQLKCTRIVIAHRLSTIRHCDRILVLDGGRIVEDGTYDELIEKDGFFRELVERQRLDVSTKETAG